MIRRRPAEYKQMALETAIRNPERYIDIFKILIKYNNVVLNDENLLIIVSDLYLNRIVSSDIIGIDEMTTINDIKELVKIVNSSRNGDGGFPKGYQSRFWTYVRTPSELGLVYARYNEKFMISEMVFKLINSDYDEQEIYSVQTMKYNRRSPYRNVSNDYNYFRFLIKVLKELDKCGKKLSYNQFIVSMFSKDGNVQEFIELINNNNFSNNEYLLDFLREEYGVTTKPGTILKDYPDVVLRMLRITGFVNIENKGILLLSLNKLKEKYIDQLLEIDFALTDEEKQDAYKYYIKLQTDNDKYFSIIQKNREDNKDDIKIDYNAMLTSIVESYDLNKEEIIEKIDALYSNRREDDQRFKYIPAPLKLEFYLSILLYFAYGKEFEIKPNYKVDSYGLPTSHAPGNIGDIEIKNHTKYWLIEVTLIRNSTQQENHETMNLFRHINLDVKTDEKFLSLVAPIIHQDTELMFNSGYIAISVNDNINNFYTKPYIIEEFVKVTNKKENFIDMKNYSDNLLERVRRRLI